MWQYDWHDPQPLDGNIIPVGNLRNIFEKRAVPLCFTQPHYSPAIWGPDRVLQQPVRMTHSLQADRGNEALIHGARRWRETRSLKHEDTDAIAGANKREDEAFAERIRRTGGEKVRWWHTRHALSQRDSLKTVKMSNFTFQPERLVSCKEVVILNLTGCKMESQDLVWVSTFMQQNATLRRLILQGNKMTAKGVEQLAAGIAEAPNLIEIDFSMNPIGDEGVANLLVALSQNIRKTVISKLALGACALTPNSTYHLVRLLRDFPTMDCMLLWRNNIGLKTDNDMAGVGVLLAELLVNKHLRLLDMSATNLSETSLGRLATDLERQAREKRLTEVEHKNRAQRIVDMSDEIERRRATAIWDDEKYAIVALEKELEAERFKFHEQLERDAAEKKNTTAFGIWRDRVMEETGRELIEVKHRVRLILRHNPAVTPSTVKRLMPFFDVSETADLDEFIYRQRTFDNIMIPRRQPGEPYELQSIPEDSSTERDRYDPFNFEDEFERERRLERDRRRKELEELRKQGYDGAGDRFSIAPPSTVVVDEEDVPDIEEDFGSGENARRARKSGQLPVDMSDGGASSSAGGRGGNVDPAFHNISMGHELETTNATTRAQSKYDQIVGDLQERQDEAVAASSSSSSKNNKRAKTTIMTLAQIPQEAPAAVEDEKHADAGDSAEEKKSNKKLMETSHALLTEVHSIALSWKKLDRLVASGADADVIDQAEAFLASEKARLTNAIVDATTTTVTTETEEATVVRPLVCASEAQADILATLIFEMTRQPEATPGNLQLTQALLQRVELPWGELLHQRNLIALAAAQGSVSYFHLFLHFSDDNFMNLDEIVGLCTTHPTCRVSLTLLLVQRFSAALALQRSQLQSMFENIASMRRELPGEDRSARHELLTTLLSVPEIGIACETPSAAGDGLSVFTRACLEGDAELLQLLAREGKITDINATVGAEGGGGVSALMLAVYSNSVDAVSFLLSVEEKAGLHVGAKSRRGENALDVAVSMGKDCRPEIVSMLREMQLTCKADERAAKAEAAAAARAEAEARAQEHLERGQRAAKARELWRERSTGGGLRR